MKLLDRYIIQTFLVSLGIVLAAMMGIALLLDLSFNYRLLMHGPAGASSEGFWTLFGNLCNYYFYKSFMYFQLLAAPSLQVAAAAALVRLSRGRELVGIKAAGISMYRVMWPMIAVGLAVNVLFILNQEVAIPSMAVELSRTLDDLVVQKEFPVDFVRDENNNIIYAPRYDPAKQEMKWSVYEAPDGSRYYLGRVRIWIRDPKFNAIGLIEADSARWDPEHGGWQLVNGVRRDSAVTGPVGSDDAPLINRIPEGPPGVPFPFYPTKVGPRQIERHRISDFHRFMSYGELTSLIEDPMRGNRRQLQVSLHQHVTGPIMNILILLLALPFVAGRDDRNYFTSVGIAVALAIAVFALTFASTAFGNAGHINPLLAAWFPVFVVLPASILSMEALKT
jgi:lipopolysaccharide export system permease protein